MILSARQLSSFLPRTLASTAAVAAFTLALLPALACRIEPIDLPPAESWHSYENVPLGVSFEVPDFFAVKEDTAGTLFRIHGANAVLLRFVDDKEVKRRGLWIGSQPAGPITLGGRAGQRYIYKHGDGPVWSLTDAYVVPYRGKQLALEFRTRNDAEVRQRMLQSFRFLEPPSPAGG